MNDRNRLSPVSLSGEDPVTQLVVDSRFADSHLLDNVRSFFLHLRAVSSIPVAGIDQDAADRCSCLGHVLDLLSILGNDLDDREIELFREGKVSVIMCRNAHDGAGTIIRQYIVGGPDRNLRAIQRIDRISSGKYTGFILIRDCHAVYVRLVGCILNILFHCFSGLIRRQTLCQGMLRAENHEGCTIEGVRAGRINLDLLIPAFNREINLRTVALADPVGLHLFDLFRPVKTIQAFQKTVCIFRDLQHPLAQILLGHSSSAALAAAVDNFFICKNRFAGRAPVQRIFLFIGKSMLKQLHKDPLRPLVVSRIRRIYLAVPVIDRGDLLDLLLDVLDIGICGNPGMLSCLDGIVFRRKTECIPSHRMDQVISLHHLIAAPCVGDYIAPPVTNVKSVSGWIRKHVEAVILFLISLDVDRVFLPLFAPFFFYRFVIV